MSRRKFVVTILIGGAFAVFGCGGEEAESLPNSSPGNLDVERVDWVVEGMSCEDEEVTRFVGLVADDDGDPEATEYLRGDSCVDAGRKFWSEIPREEGEEVSVFTGDTETSFRAESAGEHAIRLVAEQEGDDLSMRQVEPEVNPPLLPDLEGFDLAGEWWMEDYPCIDEQVPQLVRVIHPGGALHMTKIAGDACIGDGENFLDAEIDGTSLDGEALLEEESGFEDFDEDDAEAVGVTGRIRTENYIRLDVDNRAVTLRRVLGDSDR